MDKIISRRYTIPTICYDRFAFMVTKSGMFPDINAPKINENVPLPAQKENGYVDITSVNILTGKIFHRIIENYIQGIWDGYYYGIKDGSEIFRG